MFHLILNNVFCDVYGESNITDKTGKQGGIHEKLLPSSGFIHVHENDMYFFTEIIG